jgi:hypothetical protein
MYGYSILLGLLWPIELVPAKESIKGNEIVIGGHDSLLFQHNTHPLMYAVWADFQTSNLLLLSLMGS